MRARLVLGACLLALLAAPATAQEMSAPLEEGAIDALPSPQSLEDPAPRTPPVVISQNLAAPNIDALGLYPSPNAAPMHAETARALLERMPPQLPASLRAPLGQLLQAEWPLEDAPTPPGALLRQRAELLARWGMPDEALALLDRAPQSARDEESAWLHAVLLWLAARHPEACAAYEAGRDAYPENTRWAQAILFCQALNGHAPEAQLSIDLLDEQSQPVDPLLRAVIDAQRSKKPLPIEVATKGDLWHQILLVEANAPAVLTPEVLRLLPVPLLRRLGGDSHTEAALRVRVARRLSQTEASVSPGEWLTPVRMEISDEAPAWQRAEANRTYAILQALGEKVNPRVAEALHIRPPAPTEDPALNALEDAAARHDLRGLLLQLASLLPADLTTLEDGTCARIVQALQGAGERPLARQFGAETIAAFGAQAKAVPPAKEAKPAASPTPKKPAPTPAPAKPTPTKAKPSAKPSGPVIHLP